MHPIPITEQCIVAILVNELYCWFKGTTLI